MTKDQVLAEVLRWPDADREELLVALDESLHGESTDEISDEWKAEIARRVEDAESGKTESKPWAQVREDIRADWHARNIH